MKYLVLIWSLSVAFPVYPQGDEAVYIYDHASHFTVSAYQPDENYEYLVLASSFSRETVKQIPFTDTRVVKIDLVYTLFSEEEGFNQRELDLGRIRSLIEINPQITSNTFLDWNVIGQTGCKATGDCLKFFHGFVVYYEDYYTRETAKSEIDSIVTEISNLDNTIVEWQKLLRVDYRQIDCIYPESLYSQEYLAGQLEKFYDCNEDFKGRVFFEVLLDYKGRVKDVVVKGSLFPCKDHLDAVLEHILRWKRGLVIGRKQYDVRARGIVSFPIKKESISITDFVIPEELIGEYKILPQYPQCIAYETDTSYLDIWPKIEKRVVSTTLLRNNWDPELIVVDATGSMYPFTADLLKWIRLTNDAREKHYVFFNDGNDKPTNQKIIGKTGGLYSIRSNEFPEIRDKLFEAMRAGGGGDLPENNFEALLTGVQESNPTRDVIMIADNYSFPRDAALLARYTGKLRIILCNTDKGINTDYMNLARKYGFTLHTLQSDISDLTKPKMEIDGFRYTLEQDGFNKVR